MIYPFTYKIIGKLDEINYKLIPNMEPRLIPYVNWVTMPIESSEVSNWASQFRDMEIGPLSLSVGSSIPFHIDEGDYPAGIMHRVLIPLTDNFVWEWILKDGTVESVKGEINHIYIFNNMIQHRFACNEKRMCIIVNMYHKHDTITSNFKNLTNLSSEDYF